MAQIPVDFNNKQNEDLPELEVIKLRMGSDSGNAIATLHYSMDPNKDQNWVNQEKRKFAAMQMRDPTLGSWEQEMEIKFSHYAGNAVFSHYKEKIHSDPDCYPGVIKDRPLLLGFDFGGANPAFFLSQVDSCGRWIWHHGVKLERMNIREVCKHILNLLSDPNSPYYNEGGWEMKISGDNSGNFQNDKGMPGTPAEIIKEEFGLPMHSVAFTKDMKRSSLFALNDMFGQLIEGAPSIIVNPKSQVLRRLCEGGYRYKEGKETIDETDTYYVHIADAIRYQYWQTYRNTIKSTVITEIVDPEYPMEFI